MADQLSDRATVEKPQTNHRSVTKTWLHALELTAPIASNPYRTLPSVIDELARLQGERPALLSDRERLTYRELVGQSNRYARWAAAQRLAKGDVVCLLMPNRPEYLAIWLGITSIGGVVSLINANLTGLSLAHCVNVVAPRHVIVDAALLDVLEAAQAHFARPTTIWIHGSSHRKLPRIDHEIQHYSGEGLGEAERRPPALDDRALLIYTSGTTGMPKAACISHYRLMQTSHWFAGMMDVQSNDRMYNCLPMYHIVGGVQATGAVLAAGGAVVLREKFSARQFWSDVVRWDCSLFQYIGELCRYLLHAEPSAAERQHHVRLCCGNGLRPDVWNEFRSRFRIPEVLEFYGSTEGAVSLFNVEGKPGAVGRIPPFLAHRHPVTLVKFNVDNEEPIRDERGFCIRCAPHEVGEAIGPLLDDPASLSNRFEGYSDRQATEKRILRDVFEKGDAWFRTGDLMQKDEKGYFYFVDRVGDTLRWKGENVATSEVSEALYAFPGVQYVNVFGVEIPGTDGRAGMAALVADVEIDLAALRRHLSSRLPQYAHPVFLRLVRNMEVTATFKHTKTALVRQGYDPTATDDMIYFNDPERGTFVRLDAALYDLIQTGRLRV